MAFPVSLALQAAGGLASAFGGGQRIPPELAALYRLQKRAAKRLQDFSGSVPLSDPLERAALAQQRAGLGEMQRSQRDQLYAAQNPFAQTSPGDFLRNLTTQQVGQQSALDSQHLFNALQARRGALLQSAQVAQGAQGAAQPQGGGGFELAGLLGQLAERYSYRDAMRRGGGGGNRGGSQSGNVRFGGSQQGNVTIGNAGGTGLDGYTFRGLRL